MAVILTGENVEHGDSGESCCRNGEEEGEQVHERQDGPAVEDEDQNEAALLLHRDVALFVEDEECDQDTSAGQ